MYANIASAIACRLAPLGLMIVLVPALAGSSFAAADNFLDKASGTYTISPESIVAGFSVGQIPFGAVRGKFMTISGHFRLNGKDLRKSSVSLIIKPESITTENPATDAFLRGRDFFHVARFPDATFKSTRIKRTGNKTAQLTGLLKIKDISMLITFNVTFLATRKDPQANNRFIVKFSATGSFQRSKYGMSAGIPAFSDTVDLDIQVTGIRR